MPSIYDNPAFFSAYAEMPRSQGGLTTAGEWHQLGPLFPDVAGKAVLDLGCGYGWHCGYAAVRGAAEVLGLDSSARMIAEAGRRNPADVIRYEVRDLLDYAYPAARWDLVVSNLVLHYVENLDAVYEKVLATLKPGGAFLFNIEHPVFTAGVREEWITDEAGRPLYWPVDNYFYPGLRQTVFLGQKVPKYHHTLTQILGGLLRAGFVLEAVEEAFPAPETLAVPGMRDEMRRPMMLLVRAGKPV